MTTVRYKGKPGVRTITAESKQAITEAARLFAPVLKRMADGPPASDDIKSAGHVPPRALPPRPMHATDRIADQLKAKPRRAKQVKKLSPSPKLTHDERVARLVAVAGIRGVAALAAELEKHERATVELREAIALLSGENKP